jgi:predicted dehydrogenase
VDCTVITAETSSSDPVNLAGDITRDRGVVVAVGTVGMEIERRRYFEKELDFRVSRSYGPGRYDSAYEQKGRDYPIGYVRWTETRNMEAFLQFLAERKLNLEPLITHRFSIDRAQSAYELITGKSNEPFLGVVIQYGDGGNASSTLTLVHDAGKLTRSRIASTTGLSVGLLGAGGFATSTLIPAMQASSETRLVSICAATGARAKHAAKKFGFQSCTTDDSQLINDPEINTVVIATRHHLHGKQVVSALRAGKHVFCEKPLCLKEGELYEITSVFLELPEAQRPVLMMGYNRRFAPMVVQMKQFLASVAEPLALQYRINAGLLPPDHWVNDREQGGGRILGEVCHFVDLLMFLADSPITGVEARALGTTARYSGDNVLVSIHFANGSEGTISYLANGDRSFSKERIEVFGGGSAAMLEDFRQLELVRNGHTQSIRSRWRQDKGHRAEWAAFVDSIRQAKQAPIRFEDLIGSMLATLRIEESRTAGNPLHVNVSEFLNRQGEPILHPSANP